MKKIYTLASLIGFTSLTFGQAQLPNSNFENWETVNEHGVNYAAYDTPTNWDAGQVCTRNDDGSILTENEIGQYEHNTASCERAISKHGESAVKIFGNVPFNN